MDAERPVLLLLRRDFFTTHLGPAFRGVKRRPLKFRLCPDDIVHDVIPIPIDVIKPTLNHSRKIGCFVHQSTTFATDFHCPRQSDGATDSTWFSGPACGADVFVAIARQDPALPKRDRTPYHSPMPILGHGIDIVETARIRSCVDEHGQRFLDRCFTPARAGRTAPATQSATVEHLAGRFAAKEAVLKVLGTGWRGGIAWTDIEILPEPSRPAQDHPHRRMPPHRRRAGHLPLARQHQPHRNPRHRQRHRHARRMICSWHGRPAHIFLQKQESTGKAPVPRFKFTGTQFDFGFPFTACSINSSSCSNVHDPFTRFAMIPCDLAASI